LIESIIEAGQARFKPIIISTITTILWVWPSVTQDEFYAGLWYTVVFGLLFSSVITLVAVPVLYYNVFSDNNTDISPLLSLSRRARFRLFMKNISKKMMSFVKKIVKK
jgi:Cu/Ag efflux pump CusA